MGVFSWHEPVFLVPIGVFVVRSGFSPIFRKCAAAAAAEAATATVATKVSRQRFFSLKFLDNNVCAVKAWYLSK